MSRRKGSRSLLAWFPAEGIGWFHTPCPLCLPFRASPSTEAYPFDHARKPGGSYRVVLCVVLPDDCPEDDCPEGVWEVGTGSGDGLSQAGSTCEAADVDSSGPCGMDEPGLTLKGACCAVEVDGAVSSSSGVWAGAGGWALGAGAGAGWTGGVCTTGSGCVAGTLSGAGGCGATGVTAGDVGVRGGVRAGGVCVGTAGATAGRVAGTTIEGARGAIGAGWGADTCAASGTGLTADGASS